MNESEILNILIDNENALKMQSDGPIKLSKVAANYRNTLCKLYLLKRQRDGEKEKNQKRISYSKFIKSIEITTFSSPEKEIINSLKEILERPFCLPYLEYNSEILYKLMNYFFAIEVSLLSISNQNDKFYKVVCKLLSILIILIHETDELYKKIDEAEKIADQNSKNQKNSNQKEQRLEALKLHPKYPELAEAIEKYLKTGKGKDQRTLNALITEITGFKHASTRKFYREAILKEYAENKNYSNGVTITFQ